MRTPLAVLAACMLVAQAAAKQPLPPLRVTATTPTIASLVRAVGGDDVTVTLLEHGSGSADQSREAAVLVQSQLLVRNGDPAETAWLGPRLETAPAAMRPGGRAQLEVSTLGPAGECAPFELLDPMRGLALAGAIRDALERLRPPRREAFTEAYETFRGRLGVAVEPVTPEQARHLGLKAANGLLVTEVQPGSRAEDAGLAAGDVIEQANGHRLQSVSDLRQALASRTDKAGVLVINRQGNTLFVAVERERDGG
jgi:hypothetical protein